MSDTREDFIKSARPLAEALIDHAMTAGKAFGITDAKVSVSSGERQSNTVEQGEVTGVVSGRTCLVTVTLYAGDRVLSFSRNSLGKDILCRAITDNMAALAVVPENPAKRLLEKEKVHKGDDAALELYDAQGAGQEELVAYAKEAESAALAVPNVKGARGVNISKRNSHNFVLATNGLDHHESASMYQISASMVAEDASGMQSDGEFGMARHFSDLAAPKQLGEAAGRNALSKLGAVLPNTGEMPIVLNHDAAESFFSSVYDAIDGTAVHRGSTFLKGKVGQQVMNKDITLVDDPGIPRGLGSGVIDSAGLEAKKVTFVKDGVLQGYLANLMESRQLGIDPVGREDGSTNSYVAPGKVTPDALIADIKEGIYVKGFMGGTIDVNDGTHSRQAYGTLIKDGKITDIAVDGFVVSGNLKDMFMNAAIANDTPPVPSTRHGLAAPTTRINGVTIAGK